MNSKERIHNVSIDIHQIFYELMKDKGKSLDIWILFLQLHSPVANKGGKECEMLLDVDVYLNGMTKFIGTRLSWTLSLSEEIS